MEADAVSRFGSDKQDGRRRVMDCISAHPEGIATREIVEELGMGTHEVTGHVAALHHSGAIGIADRKARVPKWRPRAWRGGST